MKFTISLIFVCCLLIINGYSQTSQEQILKANLKHENKDFVGAINDLTKAIELDSLNKYAYVYRGDSKTESGDLEGAIADYSKAIEIDNRYAIAYYYRANLKARQQKFEEALEDYNS
jgi:tetratricopeptide (TPR) repeat protein